MAKKTQDKKSQEEQQAAAEAAETLGSYFRRTRRSQHVTLEEAAEATRIHVTTLKALEEDNRTALPAEVFTRGFIKIYARYLGLDPEETLQWHLQKHGEAKNNIPDEKINVQEVLASESLAESPSIVRGRHVFSALFLIVLALLVYWGYKTYQPLLSPGDNSTAPVSEKSQPQDTLGPLMETSPLETENLPEVPSSLGQEHEFSSATADTPQPPAASEPMEPVAAEPEEREPTPDTSAMVPETWQEEAQQAAPPLTAARPETEEQAQAEPQPAEAAQQAPEIVPYAYILAAAFVEDTWIRVRIDGEKPREFFFEPGQRHTWKARKNMQLFIGNAGGIALTLNGTPLPPLGASGKTARLLIPLQDGER